MPAGPPSPQERIRVWGLANAIEHVELNKPPGSYHLRLWSQPAWDCILVPSLASWVTRANMPTCLCSSFLIWEVGMVTAALRFTWVHAWEALRAVLGTEKGSWKHLLLSHLHAWPPSLRLEGPPPSQHPTWMSTGDLELPMPKPISCFLLFPCSCPHSASTQICSSPSFLCLRNWPLCSTDYTRRILWPLPACILSAATILTGCACRFLPTLLL